MARTALIADCHLGGPGGEAGPLVEQLRALPEQGCERLVLMGDIFQAWVGFPHFETPEIAAVVPVLRRLREGGLPIYYIEGNRDFFIAEGPYADAVDAVLPELAFEVSGTSPEVSGTSADPSPDQASGTSREVSGSSAQMPVSNRLAQASGTSSEVSDTSSDQVPGTSPEVSGTSLNHASGTPPGVSDAPSDYASGTSSKSTRVLAVHGDGLNDADWQYRFWRWLSKSPPARFGFEHFPRRLAQHLVNTTEARLSRTNFKHKQEIPEVVIRAYGERRLAEGHDLLVLGHFHEERRWQVPGGRIHLLEAWYTSKRVEWLGA